MKGLLPEVLKFCELKIKDPFDTRIKQTMESFDSVAKLLKWAENCLFDEKNNLINAKLHNLPNIVSSQEVVPVNNVTRRFNNNNNQRQSNYHGQTDNVTRGNNVSSDFEQIVLSKLNKLDKIENDIAELKDRVDLLERGTKNTSHSTASNTQQQQASWVEGSPRCFNCQNIGHFGKDCAQPCRTCENSNHCGGNCPVRFASNRCPPQTRAVNFVDEDVQRQDFQLRSRQL